MGALETLYALVYGKTPDSGGGSDLLGAPDRLKMYAIQKLLQGNQAISDYHDWMNDLDIEARGREGKSFDEDYLDEDTRKRIAYARQKMAERRAASVAGAEKSGEVAQERGGSSYRAAEYVPDGISRPSFDEIPVGGRKPTEAPSDGFSDTDFGSLMRRYVADAEAEERAEAERRYNSVNIDIPGGYESLQRIRQQAGGKPGGGSFSVMGGSLTGGDTTEDLRRYVEEAKRNQLDIKIATIEASAPAKYRSPATNQYLDMLYKQKAEEEASSVAAMNAAAKMRQSEANITASVAPLEMPVHRLWGVGPERAGELAKLGISTIEDLLLHAPRRYEDRRKFLAIAELKLKEAATVRGKIVAAGTKRWRKGGRALFECILDDGTARLHCRWWQAYPWMEEHYTTGREFLVFGKPESLRPRTMDHPETEPIEPGEDEFIHVNRLVPIHPLTDGLTARVMRTLVWRALEKFESRLVEPVFGARVSSPAARPTAKLTRETSEGSLAIGAASMAVNHDAWRPAFGALHPHSLSPTTDGTLPEPRRMRRSS